MAKGKRDTGTVPASDHLELKRQYDELVGRNLAGVFRTTLSGEFVECNAALADLLGYASREDLMAINAAELHISPAERQRYIAEITAKGELKNYSIALRHRSGRTIQALENVYLDRSNNGEGTIVGTMVDLSALHQADLEQRSLIDLYTKLMGSVRDGILLVRDGVVIHANPSAARLLNAGDLTGKELLTLFDEEDSVRLRAALSTKVMKGAAEPIWLKVKGTGEEELRATLIGMEHDGRPAFQITLSETGSAERLERERTRVQLAEEVNAELRREIEEHRATQQALERARHFARSLVDSSLDMIIAVDKSGMITEFNPAAELRFGHEAHEVMGRSSRMLYADRAQYDLIQKELDEHQAFTGEVRNVDRDGKVFISFLAASRLKDSRGSTIGSMGVSRDVTLAKLDREALAASEERYRDLFENATDLIQSVDANGGFQYVNTAWRKALGHSGKKALGLTLWDVVHPEDLEHCRQVFARLVGGEEVGTVRIAYQARNGQKVLLEGNSNIRKEDGRTVAIRSIFRDITSMEQARAEVQQHVAKLKAIFESGDHMFWTVDRRIALTSFNKGYSDMILRLHGQRPEINRDPGKERKRFASDDYHAFWEAKYEKAFSGEAVRFETDLKDRHDQRVCNEIFLSPVFEQDGRVTEVFGIGHEITRKKEAQERLREQSARLTAIFENAANMMFWTLDRKFRITSANERFKRSVTKGLGLSFELGDEFLGPMTERVAHGKGPQYAKYYRAALKGAPQQFEVELGSTRPGATVWVETFLNPIHVDGRVHEISCLTYEITDRKDAERELRESLHEKEVLLKEVHHRVKNNLQVISSILNLQSEYVGQDKAMLQLLRDSQDRIRSMSFIHESLYQTKNFSSIDLSEYIQGLCSNLIMSHSVKGLVRLTTDLRKVRLGLDQAIPCGLILNELVSNALKHAFPNERKGEISVKCGKKGGTVVIEVEDDGVGLAPGFDMEKDANLGLQLVQTLVQQLDGTLERPKAKGARYLITFELTK